MSRMGAILASALCAALASGGGGLSGYPREQQKPNVRAMSNRQKLALEKALRRQARAAK